MLVSVRQDSLETRFRASTTEIKGEKFLCTGQGESIQDGFHFSQLAQQKATDGTTFKFAIASSFGLASTQASQGQALF